MARPSSFREEVSSSNQAEDQLSQKGFQPPLKALKRAKSVRLLGKEKFVENYISASDEEVKEYVNPLNGMNKAERTEHLLKRWRKVYN